MSKMSNLALQQEDNVDTDYWISRCYDLDEKYNNLLKELADTLANILVKEMGVQK